MGYFDIPVDHVYCQPVLHDYLACKRICSNDLVVVSPDVGGVARERAFAKKLSDAPLAIVDKRLYGHNLAEVLLIGDPNLMFPASILVYLVLDVPNIHSTLVLHMLVLIFCGPLALKCIFTRNNDCPISTTFKICALDKFFIHLFGIVAEALSPCLGLKLLPIIMAIGSTGFGRAVPAFGAQVATHNYGNWEYWLWTCCSCVWFVHLSSLVCMLKRNATAVLYLF